MSLCYWFFTDWLLYLIVYLDDCEDVEDPDELSDKSVDDVNVPTDSLDDDIEKSVPLSSLAWEAFELSSDWSKSLKGEKTQNDHLSLLLDWRRCEVRMPPFMLQLGQTIEKELERIYYLLGPCFYMTGPVKIFWP